MFFKSKRGLMLLLALTLVKLGSGQTNLIQNGNFEELQIDTGFYSFGNSTEGKFKINDTALGWNYGDRVMMPVKSKYWSLPQFDWRVNETFYSDSGYAFSGKVFATLTPYLIDPSGNLHIDNLTVPMCRQLQAGHLYKVSFYLRYFNGTYVTDQISVGFSKVYTDARYILEKDELNETAKDICIRRAYTIPGFMDSRQYQQFSFVYEAKGSENYIYFGNFHLGYLKKAEYRKSANPQRGQTLQPMITYAIDDIAVIPLDSTERCAERSVEHLVSLPQVADTVKAGVLYFDKNDSITDIESLNGLLRKINSAGEYSGILVLGYTDNEGTVAYNQQLSERRASFVSNHLKDKTAKNITAKGMGISNATDEKMNGRRVDIYLIKK